VDISKISEHVAEASRGILTSMTVEQAVAVVAAGRAKKEGFKSLPYWQYILNASVTSGISEGEIEKAVSQYKKFLVAETVELFGEVVFLIEAMIVLKSGKPLRSVQIYMGSLAVMAINYVRGGKEWMPSPLVNS